MCDWRSGDSNAGSPTLGPGLVTMLRAAICLTSYLGEESTELGAGRGAEIDIVISFK